MRWTDQHKFCLQIIHEDIENVYFHEIEYKEGLPFLYEKINCEWVEHIVPENYWEEFPAVELPYGDCWIDEEGKLNGKLPTMPIYAEGQLVDMVNGNMLFINGDNSTGESHGMTHEEVLICANWAYSYMAMFTRFNLHHDIEDMPQLQIGRHNYPPTL